LSTSCVIFSYPKLLPISVLTFIKWRLTPSYAAKDTIFWQKRPKTIVIVIIVRMTIFKSIHMIFYVNPSWACALFINNKQHVGRERSTRGRKRTLTDSEINRNRSEVSSKWNKCRIYVGDQLDRCVGWSELKEVLRVKSHAEVAKILLDYCWWVSRPCCLLFSIVFHILWIYDDAYDHFR
jgi:hypothetical protein